MSVVPGLAIVGCLVTGVAGIQHAPESLVASALAFGILVYVYTKN